MSMMSWWQNQNDWVCFFYRKYAEAQRVKQHKLTPDQNLVSWCPGGKIKWRTTW